MFLKIIKWIFKEVQNKKEVSPQAELINIIRKIQALLSLYQDPKTQYWYAYFNTINKQLCGVHDIKKIIQRMMQIFEDPDNFDDLIFYGSEKSVKKDNKHLQQLRIELFKWCESFLDEGLTFEDVRRELESRPYGTQMVNIVWMIYCILDCKKEYYCLGWDDFYHNIFNRCMIGYGCKDICLLILESLDKRNQDFHEFILPRKNNLSPEKIQEFNFLHEQLCMLCRNTLQEMHFEDLGIIPVRQ